MKKILKKLLKAMGYTISKNSKILLLDENPFMAIKNKLIGDNLIFFDIGANWGQTTKKLSENYSNAKIYAFEPSKKCFESLNTNFKSNNISLHNLAIGLVCSQL